MVEKLTGLAKRSPRPTASRPASPAWCAGAACSAPRTSSPRGARAPRSTPSSTKDWAGFDLATALSRAIGKPCRVANDADVQGAAVVSGKGFEAVVTLGTGFGTAFFMDGRLLPHMEFAHVDFRKGESFNEQLGEPVRKKIGDKKWNKRVRDAIAYLDTLTEFDHLYIGGGNGGRVNRRDLGEVLERITVVDNSAGHPRRHQALGRRPRRAAGTRVTAIDTEPLPGTRSTRSTRSTRTPSGSGCATSSRSTTTSSTTSTP